MAYQTRLVTSAFLLASTFAIGCGSDDEPNRAPKGGSGGQVADAGTGGSGGELTPAGGGGAAGKPGDPELDPQVPPSSAEFMAAWLDAFASENWEGEWVCEAEPTEKSAGAAEIHVHGTTNRVCNNQRLAEAVLSGSDQLPVGSAAIKFVTAGTDVEVKAQADSASGQGWFWYAPGGSVSGLGASACVGCHGAAGSDNDHPGLGDFVYFQVQSE
jgi:hypothetical protein